MAEAIKELYTLPMEEQEFVLRNMSHSCDPIEINGEMYKINFEVMDLINGLHEELTKYRKIVGFGVSKNKED